MRARIAFALLATLVALAPAHAGTLFRAYVSSTGNDANPCTIAAPCRLLPAALNAIADGGEIWMLDSANYNTSKVTITKSVSILAVPGVVGSVLSTNGTSAIEVITPNASVSLRNLEIKPLGQSNTGIDFFSSSGELYVQDCRISGVANDGIFVSTSSAKATVKNSVLRQNHFGIEAIGTVTVVVDGSLVEANSGYGVIAESGARVTVTNTTIANNASGLISVGDNPDPTTVIVTHSTLTGNDTGMRVRAFQNTSASIVSDANVLTYIAGTVYRFDGAGGSEIIYTRQNNTTGYYGTLITPGMSLTALGPT